MSEEDTREFPMLVDKLDWSFLNSEWNSELELKDHLRQDWHHEKEKRNPPDDRTGH